MKADDPAERRASSGTPRGSRNGDRKAFLIFLCADLRRYETYFAKNTSRWLQNLSGPAVHPFDTATDAQTCMNVYDKSDSDEKTSSISRNNAFEMAAKSEDGSLQGGPQSVDQKHKLAPSPRFSLVTRGEPNSAPFLDRETMSGSQRRFCRGIDVCRDDIALS